MDSFFGIGIPELFMIAIIALIVLGPERIPGAMREIAKYIRYFRNLTQELSSQFGDEMKALDDLNPQRLLKEFTDTLEKEEAELKSAAQQAVDSVSLKKPAAKTSTAASVEKTTTGAVPRSTTETQPKANAEIPAENQILPPKDAEPNSVDPPPAPATSDGAPVGQDLSQDPVQRDEPVARIDNMSSQAVDAGDHAAPVSTGADHEANRGTLIDPLALGQHSAVSVNGKSAETEGEG